MNTSPGGVPITTRHIVMHKRIPLTEGSVELSAFSVAEYLITSHVPPAAVTPTQSIEKLITFSGHFQRDGQVAELTLADLRPAPGTG